MKRKINQNLKSNNEMTNIKIQNGQVDKMGVTAY